ncbi:MAG: sulfatase [Acidobacteriota bacterium]
MIVSLIVSSCAPAGQTYLQVIDWLPQLDPRIATGRILPAKGPLAPELGVGWPNVGGDGGRKVARLRGRVAEFTFTAVYRGDHLMEMELKPLGRPSGGPQRLTVSLNGAPVRTLPLMGGWQTVRLQLPDRQLHLGSNQVRLEFTAVEDAAGAGQEAGAGPQSPVPVASAAMVRGLQIRSPLGRPPWPRRPTGFVDGGGSEGTVATTGSPATGSQPSAGENQRRPAVANLSMPTDSLLDLALQLPEGARVVGRLEPQPVDPQAEGELMVAVELTDSEGREVELYRGRFPAGFTPWPAGGGKDLDLPLYDWAGQAVRLRLRVWGSANGQIVWRDLRIICRCGGARAAAIDTIDLRRPPSSGRLGRPDIFVILLDAARADAFSAYGSPHPTPVTDDLAAAGTRFSRALSPSSWTGPAVPSLLTGRYPGAHGVEVWDRRLPGNVASLPELLADAGYYTFLFSHHLIYRGNSSLRRGFEKVELVSHHERDRLPHLGDLLVNDRPTFALLHLLLPHEPYEPPSPYRGSYSRDVAARFDLRQEVLGRYPEAGIERIHPEELRYIRARYDENVSYTDHQVGEILDMLRQRGRYENSLVVLLSDHGESFLEHGFFLHTRTLYNEVLHVPLIIKWPRGTGSFRPVVGGAASLIDLAPTLVDGLGISDPRAAFQGISLLPAVFDGVEAERALYAASRRAQRSELSPRPLLALQEGSSKLVFDQLPGAVELFDLQEDPGERRNLAASEPVRAQLLLQELLAQRHRNRLALAGVDVGRTGFELDPQTLEQLRALGYIR